MNIDKLIEKGEDALKKRNYDYAISILLEAVAFGPNNRRARELLRKSELKKHEANYPGAAAVAIFGLGAKTGMFFAGLGKKGNPEAYMMACERFLRLDPKNLSVNMKLGAASDAAGHLHTAVFAYETAAEHHPENVTALKALGNLLRKQGEIQRAHDVFDKACRISPNDQEAVKSRKNLAAEVSLKTTGFESARSSQDLVKDKDQAAKLERGTRIYRTDDDLSDERQRLEASIESDPKNVDLLLNLVETIQKQRDIDGAVAVLDKAIALRPSDTAIAFQRGDLIMTGLEENVYALNKAGRNEDAAKKDAELLAFKAEEFARRVKAYPTDLNFRYNLAKLMLQQGNLDEAIAQFQQTVKDPKYKSESQLRLGQAFAEKGNFDLAIRQLANALEGTTGMSERAKEIHYSLGDIHERKGDKAKAGEEFGKVYEVDIGFRDVADRIAKLGDDKDAKDKLSLTD